MHHEFLLQDGSVNKQYYNEDCAKQLVRNEQKCGDHGVLHHDNTPKQKQNGNHLTSTQLNFFFFFRRIVDTNERKVFCYD